MESTFTSNEMYIADFFNRFDGSVATLEQEMANMKKRGIEPYRLLVTCINKARNSITTQDLQAMTKQDQFMIRIVKKSESEYRKGVGTVKVVVVNVTTGAECEIRFKRSSSLLLFTTVLFIKNVDITRLYQYRPLIETMYETFCVKAQRKETTDKGNKTVVDDLCQDIEAFTQFRVNANRDIRSSLSLAGFDAQRCLIQGEREGLRYIDADFVEVEECFNDIVALCIALKDKQKSFAKRYA